MIDVNLKGTLYMINAVVPHMSALKRGNIINVALPTPTQSTTKMVSASVRHHFSARSRRGGGLDPTQTGRASDMGAKAGPKAFRRR